MEDVCPVGSSSAPTCRRCAAETYLVRVRAWDLPTGPSHGIFPAVGPACPVPTALPSTNQPRFAQAA